ncbi:HD domain-containing protein [bacterium]|nr:HD domain-containing protein [bacterium]
MVLARPLFDENFRMLLAEGVVLTPQYVARIKRYNFPHIYIHEDGTEKIVAEDIVGINSKRKVYESYKEFHPKEPRPGLAKSATTAKKSSAPPRLEYGAMGMMRRTTQILMDEVRSSSAKSYYPSVNLATDAEFNHSVDVSLLCVLIAKNFNYPDSEISRLAQAAFIHDVGKPLLKTQLGNLHRLDFNEEQLNEYKNHPRVGAELVDQDRNVDYRIPLTILQHHEHQDGSGFPEGIKGSKLAPTMDRPNKDVIFRLAEILAVANYFDNLIKGRIAKKLITPMEAVEVLLEKTPSWFNPFVTEMAVSVINVFPVGSNVIVQDCREVGLIDYGGVVAEVNEHDLHRPKVVLLFDRRKQRLATPLIVDFSRDKTSKLAYTLEL